MLEELRFLAEKKGVVFQGDLYELWLKAKSKPRYLEEFADLLALELDRIEEENNDLLLSDERSDGELQVDKNNRVESPGVSSDGSIRDGDSVDGADANISKFSSKAFVPPVTAYHWSKKKEYLKNRIVPVKREPVPVLSHEFTIRRRVGSSVWAYYLDEPKPEEGVEYEELELNLSMEPVIPELTGLGFEDVLVRGQNYDPPDIFQHKGRVSEPININNFPDLKLDDELTSIGVDVARFGEDSSVLVIRQGIHVVDVQRFAKNDIMTTTGYVVQAINDWKPDYINIETVGGYGGGVADRLLELGLDEITNICQIETQSQNVKYERLKAFNVRSEMYLLLMERFAQGKISLPPGDEELAMELVHIKYKILSNGEIMMLEKKQIKSLLGHSPDRADALALAFYNRQEVGIW